jgi:elongator complex protein 3
MATTTITTTARRKDPNLASENERFLRCCADVANALIEDHEKIRDPAYPRRDINLNSLRAKFARKHKIGSLPPLTAIIAAVPEHYKKYILPKLVAKPISMPQDTYLNFSESS